MMAGIPLAFFLQGAGLGLTAAASPGPFQTFLISETLRGGWQRGAPIAFAPLITDAPIILLSLFLLDRMPAYFLRIVSLAGGFFVLYIAWGLWRSWRGGSPLAIPQVSNVRGGLGRGVVMNFLSPGPYLFWAFINGPILLSALRQSPLHGAAFLFGFYGVMITTLLGIAWLFHQARRLGSGVVRTLLLVSIVLLIVFAGLLFKQAMIG